MDGKHYIIPKQGEQIPADVNAGEPARLHKQQEVVNRDKVAYLNLNTATIEHYNTLPGVGEATANKIITYREENGDLNVEDLKMSKELEIKNLKRLRGIYVYSK